MTKTRIDRDTEVYVGSNVFSSYSLLSGETALELAEHGDEDTLTFGELKKLSSGRNKAALQKMYLLITDVASEDFDTEDVIEQLKLKKIYDKTKELFDVDEIGTDTFEEFVTKCTETKLEKALEYDNIRAVLVDCVIDLYTRREISDSKLKIALGSIGIKDVYSVIEDLESSK